MQSFDIVNEVTLNDLTVVIPEKNEDINILRHLKQSLENRGAEVIVVDDGSDNPPSFSYRHDKNLGYGQALITGITLASRPYIMTIDGDGQHSVAETIKLYIAYKLAEVDMMIGARRLSYESVTRMLGRKALNMIASFFAFRWLSDLNSGARIFRRENVIGYFPILCKTFSFTTSLTMSMLCDNYKVEWFPIQVNSRRCGKSHVKVVRDGLVTLKYILWIGLALRTRKLRERWRKLKSLFLKST